MKRHIIEARGNEKAYNRSKRKRQGKKAGKKIKLDPCLFLNLFLMLSLLITLPFFAVIVLLFVEKTNL
jgi:hypothetical protein